MDQEVANISPLVDQAVFFVRGQVRLDLNQRPLHPEDRVQTNTEAATRRIPLKNQYPLSSLKSYGYESVRKKRRQNDVRIPRTIIPAIRSMGSEGSTSWTSPFMSQGNISGRFLCHSRKPQRVKIRFSSAAAHVVRERIWHPTQEIRQLSDGRAEISLEVPINYDIISRFLDLVRQQ